MWPPVRFQRVFRPVWVLVQTHTRCGLRLLVPDCWCPERCRRVPLQHPTVVWKLLHQRPPLNPRTPEVSNLGKHARVCRAALLASDFPGVVASGGGSPGCPLQPLGFFWQLWHRNIFLLLHSDRFGIKHRTKNFIFQYFLREHCTLVGLQFCCCTVCSLSELTSFCRFHCGQYPVTNTFHFGLYIWRFLWYILSIHFICHFHFTFNASWPFLTSFCHHISVI